MLDIRRSKSENCFRRSIFHDYNPLDSLNEGQILDTEVKVFPQLEEDLNDYYANGLCRKEECNLSPTKSRQILKPKYMRMSKNRRGCNISKQPSSSQVGRQKSMTPSSPCKVDTISSISPPVSRAFNYKLEPKKVANFNQEAPVPVPVVRCNTMNEDSSGIIKLDKTEKMNQTPCSAIKKKTRIDYARIITKKIAKKCKSKSPQQYKLKTGRKKSDLAEYVELLAKHKADPLYVKSATKSSKKPKRKKSTRKKLVSKKFSFKVNKTQDQRTDEDMKNDFPYHQTFDEQMSCIYKEGSTKCSQMKIFENFSSAKRRNRGEEFSK